MHEASNSHAHPSYPILRRRKVLPCVGIDIFTRTRATKQQYDNRTVLSKAELKSFSTAYAGKSSHSRKRYEVTTTFGEYWCYRFPAEILASFVPARILCPTLCVATLLDVGISSRPDHEFPLLEIDVTWDLVFRVWFSKYRGMLFDVEALRDLHRHENFFINRRFFINHD